MAARPSASSVSSNVLCVREVRDIILRTYRLALSSISQDFHLRCPHGTALFNCWIYSVTCSADGTPFSGSNDHTIRSWDREYKQCESVLMGHMATVSCLKFSPTEPNLLLSGGWDHDLRLWDTKSAKCVGVLSGHTDRVHAVDIADHVTFSASSDFTVKSWDLRKNSCLHTFQSGVGPALCCSVVDNDLFISSKQGSLRRVNIKTGEESTSYSAGTSDLRACTAVRDAVYCGSDDGTLFAFELQSCSLQALQPKNSFAGHSGAVTCLQMHGNSLFSGSLDGSIKEWSLDTGECTRTFERAAVQIHCLYVKDKFVYIGADEEVLRCWSLA